MKYSYISLIICFCISVSTITAQEPGNITATGQSRETTTNAIPAEEIRINGKMEYTTTSSQMFNIYGNPTKTEEVYWEISEQEVKKYEYEGATFFFAQDRMESFKLFSPTWFLETNKTSIKVNNNINTLSTFYPKAYLERQNGNLSIPIGTGDYKFILIEYNSDNLITCIEQRYF